MKKTLFFLLPLTILIGSCEDDLHVQAPEKGNYFPTTKGSYWTYETKYNCYGPTTVCYETRQSVTDGDELPGDESYQPYSSAIAPFQFVKVSNHEYFGYGYYMPEYKFLDDDSRVNTTWVKDGGSYFREKFVVVEVNATKEIRGLTFSHVIVVKNTYSVPSNCEHKEFVPVTTTTRYYAKGIGEIYMIRTDHQSNETAESFLIDYFIAQ